MYDKFKERAPYELLNTSKYPPEVAGRFNSFITTQFDDSLSVEMQMRSIIKWAIDNFKHMDETYNDFTEYVVQGNLNPFIQFLNDLIVYMNEFIETFDTKFQDEILLNLQKWNDDGTLETLINESLDTKYHEMDQRLTTQLAQTTLEAERKRGLNDLTTEVIEAISGGDGTSFNLLSIPEDDSVEYEKTTFIEQSKNLFNKENVLLNSFFSGTLEWNTIITLNNYYVTNKPIYLKGGRSYTIQNVRTYVILDVYGNATPVTTNDNNATVTIESPEKGGYLIMAGSMNNLDTTQVEEGSSPTNVVPYNITFPEMKFTNEQLDGLRQKLSNDDGGSLYYTKQDNFIEIVSKDKNNTITTEIDLKGSANGTVKLLDVKLNGQTIHRVDDDITPVRTVSTVGANHGYTTAVVGDMFPENMRNGQLYPSVKNITNSISENNNSIVVRESYEILDPTSLISWKERNPTLDYTNHLNNIESVMKVIITYTFTSFGKCKIDTTLVFLKDSTISSTGFLQSRRLENEVTRYMSGVSVDNHDFASGVNLNNYNENILIRDDHLINPEEPPLFYTDKTSQVSFTMGYVPEQNAMNSNRKNQTSIYWDLRSTGKSYPVAVGSALSPVSAGTVFQVSGFRNYNVNEKELITFEVVESGDYWYIYIYSLESQNLINREMDIPSGKEVETVVNNGVHLITTTTGAGGITFSTEEKASAIFRVGK